MNPIFGIKNVHVVRTIIYHIDNGLAYKKVLKSEVILFIHI